MKGERWFYCFRILEDDAVPMSFLPPRHGDRGDHEEPMGCDTVAGAMSSVNIPEQNVAFWSIVSIVQRSMNAVFTDLGPKSKGLV